MPPQRQRPVVGIEGTFLDAFKASRQLVIDDYQSQPNRVRVMPEIQSAVMTPVRVRDEHIGALGVFFSTAGRHASEPQLEVLRLLAGHAGTAIANARKKSWARSSSSI